MPPRKKNPGSPKHRPTKELRRQVETMAGLGIRQIDMCPVVGVSKPTLEKYYRKELDSGMAKARTRVAQTLFQMATTGRDFQATKYWLEQQGGDQWVTRQRHEHTGTDGSDLVLKVVYDDA